MYIAIGYILVFCQQLVDIFWYWIYSANNWGIYSNTDMFCQQLGDICQLWGVCAPFGRRVADCTFTRMCIFFKAYSATLHPPIDIYPPVLVEYRNTNKEIQHIFPNYWQNISNTNISIQLTYIPQLLAKYIRY